MPSTVVDIDLRQTAGAVPRPTYSDLVVIGDEPDIADPTYNEPIPYDTASAVETDFGTNSDVYAASQEIQNQGADEWWVVMLDHTQYTESGLNNSDTSAVQSFTLSNTPIRAGVSNVTITLDGTAQTIIPTTETSPTAPASGEVKLNFDTGEGITGDTSSGTGTGIEATYDVLDWSQATTRMSPRGLDLAVLADVRADKSYIGDLDELLIWASSGTGADEQEASVVVAYEDGSTFADDTAAMNTYHEMGKYLTSGHLLPIAHKSTDDVASGIASRISTKRPWFDPYWDGGADYGFTNNEFRPSLVGKPSQPGTLEGGDANGNGPVNVLQNVNGVQVLSNSLTTAGAGSDYQYFDVRRTETFLINEIQQALNSLRLRRDQIPFASIGRTLIQDAISDRLARYASSGGSPPVQLQQEGTNNEDQNAPNQQAQPTGPTGTEDGGVPLREFRVRVPEIENLSEDDRANRVWNGIEVTGTLAGNTHTFGVELTVQV